MGVMDQVGRRLELRGREVWLHEVDGECYRLASIPEDVTVEQWLERWEPPPAVDRG